MQLGSLSVAQPISLWKLPVATTMSLIRSLVTQCVRWS